jgi:hypothetical protein
MTGNGNLQKLKDSPCDKFRFAVYTESMLSVFNGLSATPELGQTTGLETRHRNRLIQYQQI